MNASIPPAVLAMLICICASFTSATCFAAPDNSEARIAALEARIRVLEQKMAAPLTVKAPFTVVDAAGKKLAKIDSNQLELFDESQKAGITMQARSASTQVVVGYKDFSKPLVVMSTGASNTGVKVFAANQSAHAVAFMGIAEDPAMLTLKNASGDLVVKLFAENDSGRMDIMRKGGKTAASVSTAEDGGTVKAFSKEQKAVAGLFAGSDGGNLVLTGPGGGKTAVGLSVTPTGGKVRVYPAGGGTARAELIADGDSGAMSIFNGSGTAALLAESGKSGSGRLVVLNAAGENAVEVGAIASGIGIVRTGPGGFGPAGSIGGGLTPASSIQGKKGGK